ncbi:carboxymuconolactone decarboxylase family protein [Desulfoscipio sp. XC116]|uniref:carboxymuconolactone decarboxylase family protein n=1 Tax=Desulfoscipio sp. XC116 TaxID=3144975 RepID=UPI00325B6A54
MAHGKKLYSVYESYRIFYKGLFTIRYMFKSKKKKELSPQFIERIMLAVTEVNNCAVCSYVHTKMALEKGMGDDEIRKILAGVMDDVPSDEVAAVMFAQHYADTGGNPAIESWQCIVETYGMSKAKGILGTICTIMLGNTYGIVWSSLFNRLRGKPDQRSNLLYEVSMIITGIIFLPIAFTHAIISVLLGMPVITFLKDT